MDRFFLFFILASLLGVNSIARDGYSHLDDLLEEIKTVLNAEDSQTRQHQYPYGPQNNGISVGVYEALRSIVRNDELECVSRLLCEAAAGGRPGHSGKQIKFDKLSLTRLISYLKLDAGSSSPLLVFGRAALLGVSNRGDPYSCIINYPKCPKDQSRLLYYLNNHRGGFFQYFDKKHHKPGNYYYQNQYRPGYYQQSNYYGNKYNRNKIQFETSDDFYEKLKKKAGSGVYAKKYAHSSLAFPGDGYRRDSKPMTFPRERSEDSAVDPRILTKPGRSPQEEFFFSDSNRFPKKFNDVNFFPRGEPQPLRQTTAVVSDRLPKRFHFPQEAAYSKYPLRYSPNSFFPAT